MLLNLTNQLNTKIPSMAFEQDVPEAARLSALR